MVTFNIHTTEIAVFLAILLRMSIVLFMTPLFTSGNLPSAMKICVALALSVMVYMLPGTRVAPLSFEPATLIWITIAEVILGMVVGFTFYLVFGAFQLAGELISFQMGFGFAQVADPQSGAQVTVMSSWFQILAMLIFFSLNGHHMVIKAIFESYRTIPIGGLILDAENMQRVISLSGQLFVISVKIAAPVMATLLLTHVGLGLMSKFAPQLNILMASFPLTILFGFIFLGLSISIWGDALQLYIGKSFQFLRLLLHLP